MAVQPIYRGWALLGVVLIAAALANLVLAISDAKPDNVVFA